ncbi:MAG: glycosyltransferase family 2 protein [Thiohalomonadales bacterium]
MEYFITIYGAFFCFAWWSMYGRIIQSVVITKNLSLHETITVNKWPSITIVIAACNEEDTLESSVNSLLEQDYDNLKIILVNDRSSDNTFEIVNNLAEDNRVSAIHIKELPENWLGKVHALSVAVKGITSDWILFTDADVNFEKTALTKSMSFALSKNADHLTLFPELIVKNFLLEIFIRTFGFLFLFSTKSYEIDKTPNKTVIGIGAFNLVKKSMLDKSEGFDWLKMEVADDAGLGLLIKRAGGKSVFAFANNLVSLEWYPSVSSMFVGLEKNLFSVAGQYNIFRLITVVLLIWIFVAAPFVVLIWSTKYWLIIMAYTALACPVLLAIVSKIKLSTKFSIGLFVPFGQLVISLMMIRSAVMCITRGGIEWRGTFYPIKQLKKYQRVKF